MHLLRTGIFAGCHRIASPINERRASVERKHCFQLDLLGLCYSASLRSPSFREFGKNNRYLLGFSSRFKELAGVLDSVSVGLVVKATTYQTRGPTLNVPPWQNLVRDIYYTYIPIQLCCYEYTDRTLPVVRWDRDGEALAYAEAKKVKSLTLR